jgi:uncharacterized membrane-anchored protein
LLIQQIESSLNYREGKVKFEEEKFTLELAEHLHLLDKEQANYVLTNLYGNQKDSLLLGLIKSKDKGVLATDAWAISLSYHPIGYTIPEKHLPAGEKYWNDKQMIQFDSLNQDRGELGYSPVNFGGFQIIPTFQNDHSSLHWAKSILFPGDDQMTLNYTALIFGRYGHIKLNAVSSLSEAEEVSQSFLPLINQLKFEDGFRYNDHLKDDRNTSNLSMENLIVGSKPINKEVNTITFKIWYVLAPLFIIFGFLVLRFYRKK